MRTEEERAPDEGSKEKPELGWPISVADHGDYTTIGLPDRLSDGRPFTEETYHQFPTLEELGIEDWSSDVLNAVIPDDRAVAVCSSTSTWKPSRWRRADRQMWSHGVRWRWFSFGGWLSLLLPSGISGRQQILTSCLGFEDDGYPQVILAYSSKWSGNWKPKQIHTWCRNENLWSEPSCLLESASDQAMVIFDGWIFLVLSSALAENTTNRMRAIADFWSLSLTEGYTEGSWF